jgi:tetratricopeptide (TPR) repeat protein
MQIAIEYAHRYRNDYNAVFFIRTDTETALTEGLVEIAGVLALPGRDAKDQKETVGAVKRWLLEHDRWLLIADNADDLALVKNVLPFDGPGRIVLTTRAAGTCAVAEAVKVKKMEPEEGACFLLRRAGLLAWDSGCGSASGDQQAAARELSIKLDGLPLALDQAGAYVEETGCGLSVYLDLYRNHAPELLRRRGALSSDHPDPVATTWALSFENIEKASPAAAELLRFCAFLDPDQIPEEVFSEGAPELGPVLGPIGSDALELNSSISEILKYSLLRRDANSRTLEIHRLVQAVLKQPMGQDTQRLWAERAVRVVNHAFPRGEFSTWVDCERFLAQAHACAELISEWGFEFAEAAQLLNQAGFYLSERGRYTDAEPLYRRALAIREKTLEPEHPDVATSVNNLARLYATQGQYAKAEPLYQRTLAIREKVLGPDHPAVATSLNGLARLYNTQGQYAKAEPLYQRALAIREKVLGPEHLDVATSLNNLALLYANIGQYAKAEPIFERALAIREKALGSDHSNVATILHNLGLLYRDQGQYTKAESLFERALTIREKTLGPDHPDLATSLSDAATLYYFQGQYAKVEPLLDRSLAIREKVLGSEHPDVAASLNGLAMLYANIGQYAKAEPLYQRALAIWEKALGPEHPPATCLENYALLLQTMGRSEEAGQLEARGRAIRAKSA